MKFRVVLLAGVVALLAVVALSPGGAGAAGPTCTLNGAATFSKPLKLAQTANSYTFTGKLTNCVLGGAIKTANVSASGSGKTGCSGNSTKGTATLSWNTGQSSSFSFSTTGVGNIVVVQGTITSGKFAGQKAKALLAFTTTTPSADKCATTGVNKANFSGQAELGV
jgi:hypothetical protein